MSKYTLEKIAEMAGVSRSTVSRVVREEGSVSPGIKQRVMDVVRQTGYRPNPAARSLAGQRTDIIGLVISKSTESLFDDPYFARLIQGVTQATNRNELMLTLFLFHDQSDHARFSAQIVNNQLVDGFIVTDTYIDDPLVSGLIESGIPFVLIGQHSDPRVNYLNSDNVDGAVQAVAHLRGQGYQRIATISGDINNHAALDRLEGYKKGLLETGQPVDPALITFGDFTEESGYLGMRTLLSEKPDAVFAASDAMALGAARAIREAGLEIPADIALVGFDDLHQTDATGLQLTSVRQPIRRAGQMAVDVLLDVFKNREDPPRRLNLPTELVVRESSGRPR